MSGSILAALGGRPLILAVVDLPHTHQQFGEALARSTSGDWFASRDVVSVGAQGYGFWRFSFPTEVRARDLPIVATPAYRFGNRGGWPASPPMLHRPEGGSACFDPVDETTLLSLVASATVVVNLYFGNRSGIRAFHLALSGGRWTIDKVPLSSPDVPILDARIANVHPWTMDRVVSGIASNALARWPSRPEKLHAALAKEFFDYNWAFNNRALMPALLKAAGCERSDLVDKFQKASLALLLYLVRDPAGSSWRWSYSSLRRRMSDWDVRPDGSIVRLCSNTADDLVFFNLLEMGLIERDKNGASIPVVPTAAGRRLSDLLPKDAYDPHQPRRIEDWIAEFPASRPAMERYLGTYWAKIRNASARLRQEGP